VKAREAQVNGELSAPQFASRESAEKKALF